MLGVVYFVLILVIAVDGHSLDADHEWGTGMTEAADVDIALSVLDHQLVDATAGTAGRSTISKSPVSTGDSPEVVEILVGGNAWRSRGLLGRLAARLSGDAVHVPWPEVDSVTSVVTLKRPPQSCD